LGFELQDQYTTDDMQIALITSGETILELFQMKDTKPLPDYRKDTMNDLYTVGTKHLCLEVDDLGQTINTLKEKNVEIIGNIDTPFFGGKYIFIKDCNRISIELYQKS
jgi:hypothetical protein